MFHGLGELPFRIRVWGGELEAEPTVGLSVHLELASSNKWTIGATENTKCNILCSLLKLKDTKRVKGKMVMN